MAAPPPPPPPSRKANVPIDECLFGGSSDSNNNDDAVSLPELRRIASLGIVDQGSFRGIAWRLLLGYISPNRLEWNAVLTEQRTLYCDLIQGFFSHSTDNGNDLRGHHGKRAAVRRKQREEERKQREEERLEQERQREQVDRVLTQLEKASLTDDTDTKQANTSTSSSQDETVSMECDAGENNQEEEVIPTPPSKDGSTQCVPSRIREQWKRSGRDSSVLVEISNGHSNVLLIPEDESSKWEQFYENATLLDEIRKDVVRTHPDLFFFLEPEQNLGQRRHAAMERILFLWAKLNKGVSYILMCVYIYYIIGITHFQLCIII